MHEIRRTRGWSHVGSRLTADVGTVQRRHALRRRRPLHRRRRLLRRRRLRPRRLLHGAGDGHLEPPDRGAHQGDHQDLARRRALQEGRGADQRGRPPRHEEEGSRRHQRRREDLLEDVDDALRADRRPRPRRHGHRAEARRDLRGARPDVRRHRRDGGDRGPQGAQGEDRGQPAAGPRDRAVDRRRPAHHRRHDDRRASPRARRSEGRPIRAAVRSAGDAEGLPGAAGDVGDDAEGAPDELADAAHLPRDEGRRRRVRRPEGLHAHRRPDHDDGAHGRRPARLGRRRRAAEAAEAGAFRRRCAPDLRGEYAAGRPPDDAVNRPRLLRRRRSPAPPAQQQCGPRGRSAARGSGPRSL